MIIKTSNKCIDRIAVQGVAVQGSTEQGGIQQGGIEQSTPKDNAYTNARPLCTCSSVSNITM